MHHVLELLNRNPKSFGHACYLLRTSLHDHHRCCSHVCHAFDRGFEQRKHFGQFGVTINLGKQLPHGLDALAEGREV